VKAGSTLEMLAVLKKMAFVNNINLLLFEPCISFIPRRRWEDNIKMDLQEVGWGKD
jgi:hypothetical protein